jgi:hypothetical protein
MPEADWFRASKGSYRTEIFELSALPTQPQKLISSDWSPSFETDYSIPCDLLLKIVRLSMLLASQSKTFTWNGQNGLKTAVSSSPILNVKYIALNRDCSSSQDWITSQRASSVLSLKWRAKILNRRTKDNKSNMWNK